MKTIADRFCKVIDANLDGSRRWATLEGHTGIPAASWQRAYNMKQRPTAEMLEAVARIWPANAFWLVTGITDAKHGHVACSVGNADAFFPERHFATRRAALTYFELASDMYLRIYKDEKPMSEEQTAECEMRLLMLERSRDEEAATLSRAEENDLQDRLGLAIRRLERLKESAASRQDHARTQTDPGAVTGKRSGTRVKK
jgi:hypothetical protein